MYLLDTNVVIRMRDGDGDLLERLSKVPDMLAVSVVTAIELEGGLHYDREDSDLRRERLGIVMEGIAVLPFEEEEVTAYRSILEARGYSRRKVLDRMIAAQAITSGATLATENISDFEGIAGLELVRP